MTETTLTVKIEQKHIDEARRLIAEAGKLDRRQICPLALALNEQQPDAAPWTVSCASARGTKGLWRAQVDAFEFVRQFDAAKDVQSCEVTLASQGNF
jgi:uncharacterized protein YaaQ